MKAIFFVLAAIFAVTLASEFSLACTVECASYYTCKAKGAWNGDYSNCAKPSGCVCDKFYWQKDDALTEKFNWKKVVNFGKKAFNIYKKAKSFGILADSEKKINWKKIFSEKNIDKAYQIWKIFKSDDVQSDAEFLKKISKFAKKVAPIAKKGFNIYKKAKTFGLMADSEKFNWKKVANFGKKAFNIYKKAKSFGLLADSEKFNWKKVANFGKKAFNIYKKAKSFGLLADEAAKKPIKVTKKPIKKVRCSTKPHRLDIAKLKKLAEKFKGKKIDIEKFKKILVKKIKARLAKKIAEKKEKKIPQKKEKRVKKPKTEKKFETESDAEFFKKLANWWNTKGKKLYQKGKAIYDVVKKQKSE